MSKKEICLFLIAAIGHDTDHPGFSNAHEVARKSQIAERYKGESVLENHHAQTSFEVMRRPESSILSFLPEQE